MMSASRTERNGGQEAGLGQQMCILSQVGLSAQQTSLCNDWQISSERLSHALSEDLIDSGMFWGLTNQKACVRSALAMAIQKDWAFVIPWWRVAYSPHKFDPHKSLIEPLSFMYNMSALAEWASEKR